VNKKLINVIAVVITAIWSISFILDAINPRYDPPESVHALMLIVAGATFTGSVIKSRSGDDS
jgi:hypothetical protein